MNLKPMNVGEILDNTFTLYKEQFKSYLAMAVISTLPQIVFAILFATAFFLMGEIAGGIIAIVAILPMMAATFAITGGMIKKASEQIMDREITVIESFRCGLRKFWPLFSASLLYVIFLVIGCILLIIPGIYVATLFAFFMHTIIIEDKGPWSALKRSKDLIKGSWWRSFGIIILIIIFVSILTYIAAIPVGMAVAWLFGGDFIGQIVSQILVTAVSCLFIPISLIAYTLLYYDLRIRKENLDVQLMVDNLTEQSGSHLSGE